MNGMIIGNDHTMVIANLISVANSVMNMPMFIADTNKAIVKCQSGNDHDMIVLAYSLTMNMPMFVVNMLLPI